MKISELFEDTDNDQTIGLAAKRTPKQSYKYQRPEGYNYTPGKNALDKMYDETDEFTGHPIVFRQEKLDDPRN